MKGTHIRTVDLSAGSSWLKKEQTVFLGISLKERTHQFVIHGDQEAFKSSWLKFNQTPLLVWPAFRTVNQMRYQ